jgi:hypothetical protein
MAWLSGAAPPVTGAGPLRWFELSLAPAYALPVDAGLELSAGVVAAAAVVHLGGVSAVDDVPGQLDTWSARVAAPVHLSWRLSRSVELRGGLEAGAVLRRILVRDEQAGSYRLGGLWLGATFGVALDPQAPTCASSAGARAPPSRGSRSALRGGSVAAQLPPAGGSRAP